MIKEAFSLGSVSKALHRKNVALNALGGAGLGAVGGGIALENAHVRKLVSYALKDGALVGGGIGGGIGMLSGASRAHTNNVLRSERIAGTVAGTALGAGGLAAILMNNKKKK